MKGSSNMFNAEKETNKIIEFIKDYYEKNNLGGVVLGISGGKDSGVVAALFTKALGKENVLGVTMPCHSIPDDKNLAKVVSDFYGFELINVDLTNPFDSFKEEIDKLGTFTEDELKAFNNQWEKEKDHFFDSVNIRLAYKGPIEEE